MVAGHVLDVLLGAKDGATEGRGLVGSVVHCTRPHVSSNIRGRRRHEANHVEVANKREWTRGEGRREGEGKGGVWQREHTVVEDNLLLNLLNNLHLLEDSALLALNGSSVKGRVEEHLSQHVNGLSTTSVISLTPPEHLAAQQIVPKRSPLDPAWCT